MKGFFKVPAAIQQTAGRKGGYLTCSDCGLHAKSKSPRMEPSGKGRKGIYNLAEASGGEEDRLNTQLVGPAGQLYRRKLAKFGVDLDLDCWKDNATRCRPFVEYRDRYGKLRQRNRPPSTNEINCCRLRVHKSMQTIQPEKIFLLGSAALSSFLGHRTTNLGPISKWIGWAIPDQTVGAWVFPMYHPSYLTRNPDDKALERLFERQLRRAIEWDRPFPRYGDENKKVVICNSLEHTKKHLRDILEMLRQDASQSMAFDYETTGLKPHAPGHKIICMSISTAPGLAVSFPMYPNSGFLDLIKQILTDHKIKKTAQNAKFEDTWTRSILGYKVEGWDWDTMLASHTLDNRSGITGLKFQAYARYGILGYDDEVAPYIKTSKKKYGANAFNRLEQFFASHPEKVLTYCGMDSMFTYRMAMDQKEEMPPRQVKAFRELMLKGTLAFSDVEEYGIHVDTDYYEKQKDHLERRIAKMERRIARSDEARLWKKAKGKLLNPGSDSQLKILLYDMLKFKPTKLTTNKNPSVDQQVLVDINTPFTNSILRFRKLSGLRDKIAGVLRETVDSILRPVGNLNTVSTYRSSATDVNFHNFDKRDELAQQIVRSGIKPRPGHQLLSVDYGKIEVVMGCCNSQDPELIKYMTDPTTDMHRDEAMRIFLLDQEQVTSNIRYHAKNKFVFPEFYGSYWGQCAPELWKAARGECLEDGTPMLEHLAAQGISRFAQFEQHVKKEEDWYWNTKYKVYTKWKTRNWERYQKRGCIDQLTGFRCHWGKGGLMGRNDSYDYPNQGPAFHCLLWSYIQLNDESKLRLWDSRIIAQIHDEMIWDVEPVELIAIKPVIRKVMCEEIRVHWPWLIVPLSIEAKISEVDGNWFSMRKTEI